MISLFISLIGILTTILFVVGTHESAHFLVARLLNIKILRFSIGFGKTLFHWHDKKGTEYVIALVPLGGYVKMLDEAEGDVPKEDLPFAFNRQPFYKKFLVVLAGPAMNLFCAFILYWMLFAIGFTTLKPLIGNVAPNSISAAAGIQSNQEIIAVDNEPTATWTSILFRLIAHIGNQDTVKIAVKNLSDNKITSHTLNLSQWHMDELSPDPLASIGITPYEPEIPLIIGMISPDSPAAHSSLKLGDKILALNNKPIKNWSEFMTIIINHPAETITLTIERQKKQIDLPITVGFQRNIFFQKSGYLGIAPTFNIPQKLLHKIQYNFFAAAPKALQEMVNFTYFNLVLFGKLFTGKLSLKSLGGPITIFESAGTALNYGFLSFIGFLAFLSISIGIINLLPIPGLDGGHLAIQIIESISQKTIPERVLVLLYHLGFIFIFLIIIQAVVNDILRLY
ncbi:MAG: RIP metalloprotease RseP [Gammaproteobacteria bacterium]|nr:RIP metalloprotease RseP [Gammaproteobacteria bacterium]